MIKSIIAACLLLWVGGCTHFGYYAQVVEGHVRLMAATRPIPEWLTDETIDPALRRRLEQASAIREFASRDLGLPDNDSYRGYADVGRPYVVWNVFSAPEFSVDLNHWCPVLVGCVSYRGYYDQGAAQRYADELGQEGADTTVRGILAYSTLGYFSDPVLNTFLRYGDQEVARIVFHELAHQLVYAAGDTAFNESFASAVEHEGIRRWLAHSATPERLRDFETQQQRRAQFLQLLADTREQLRGVYASPLEAAPKRRAKLAVIADLKQRYAELKASWNGYAGYDPWFSQPVNNAALGAVALYTQWMPAFRVLLEQEDGNLPHFYARVESLAQLPKAERTAALEQLMPSL